MSYRGPLGGIREYLGIGELSFDLDDHQGRALRMISVLPGLALLALLATFLLDIAHDPTPVASYGFWDRLQTVAAFLQTPLVYIGLAALIVFGIGRVSYELGSYAFAVAAALIAGAFLTAVYASMLYLFLPIRTDPGDYYLFTATRATFVLGVLAVGYSFLAYRGLSGGSETWDDDEQEAPA